jgi:hypothetical protein
MDAGTVRSREGGRLCPEALYFRGDSRLPVVSQFAATPATH